MDDLQGGEDVSAPPDTVLLAVFLAAFGCIALAMVALSLYLDPDDERFELMAPDNDYRRWE